MSHQKSISFVNVFPDQNTVTIACSCSLCVTISVRVSYSKNLYHQEASEIPEVTE